MCLWRSHLILFNSNIILREWTIVKQEHPIGGIADPQVLKQYGLNSLHHNGLETPIIITHAYDIF